MNWRIRFLNIFLLLVFCGGAFLYFRMYVNPKPHAIIIFIAPGLNLKLASPDSPLFLATQTALLQDQNSDAAALYSALSTGIKGKPNAIGISPDGKRADNLFYMAQRSNRLIGLISTGSLTHPACAAFYGHTPDATNRTLLSQQLFDSTEINVILGGSYRDLILTKDRNLIQEAVLSEYRLVTTPAELEATPTWRTRKLLGLFDYPDASGAPEEFSDTPPLPEMLATAIKLLQFNLGGYFLVITHPKSSAAEGAGQQIREMEQAVNTALEYTGEKSLIVLLVNNESSPDWISVLRGSTTLPGFLTPETLHSLIQKEL